MCKVQEIEGKIIKKGRKYFKFVENGRDEKYPVNMVINELSKNFQVGEVIKVKVNTEFEYNRYMNNYKITHTPINEDTDPRVENTWGWIQKSFDENRVYETGIARLHDLGCHKYDDEIKEKSYKIYSENSIGWVRYNYQKENRIYENGVKKLHELGNHDYDDEIESMRDTIYKQKVEEGRNSDIAQLLRHMTEAEKNLNHEFVYMNNCREDDNHLFFDLEHDKVYKVTYLRESHDIDYDDIVFDEYMTFDVTELYQKELDEKLDEHNNHYKHFVMNGKECKVPLFQLEDEIRINDDLNFNKAKMPNEGVMILDTIDMYGTGKRIVIDKDNEIWCITNNGMDGDNWERNHISTGGAGAWGYRCPLSKVSHLIREV